VGGVSAAFCAISPEFAAALSSSARGLIRQFAALGPRVHVQIMMLPQKSRRAIMIRTDHSSPPARPTCGNGRGKPGRTHGLLHS
jgi:hypothetical protein